MTLSPPSEQRAERFIKLDLSLEEYLDGHEVDVDIVLYKNQCYFASVVDNGPTVEPYFAETWNLCPSILPEHQQKELLEEALSTLRVLGFQSGVFHVEERYTSRGPRIIEVNARMGGGPIRLQHKFVYGVDLVVEQLLLALDLPPSVDTASAGSQLAEAKRSYISSTPNASRSGTIACVDFLGPIRAREDLVGLWEFVAAGEVVVGPEEGQPSWLWEIAIGGAAGEGEQLLKKMTALTDALVNDVEQHYYQ